MSSSTTGIEQVLPLVLFLLIFLALKWVQRSRTKGANGDSLEDPQNSPSSEESMRKLLEALGLPENSLPPPLVIQKKPPSLSVDQEPLASSPPVPPPLPTTASASATQTFTAGVSKAAVFQRTPKISKSAREIVNKTTTRGLKKLQKELHNPCLLRRTIVLREILGQPKAYAAHTEEGFRS